MFPIKWNDFFRKKDGTFVSMEDMGGGSSVNWMSQSEWNELTFDEKKAAGFTAIGSQGSTQGTYYDYSNVTNWKYNSEYANVIDIFFNGDFNFHGFVSDTAGDIVVTGSNISGTRTSSSKVFICNGVDYDNYGYFMMFGKTEADLQCDPSSYYTIKQLPDYNLYVGGNMDQSIGGNADVILTHNSVAQNLKDYFARADYSITGIRRSSGQLVIPDTFAPLFEVINEFLSVV